jgi:hypothetical protein
MSDATQTAQAGRSIAQLAELAEVSEEARALLAPDHGPREFLQALVDKEQYSDAVRLLAHGLPRREAVWWAWVCARRAAGETPAPKIKAALDATELWIREPTDERRRAAMQRSEEADFGTPAGCAGLAAFLSGDNLAPANVPQPVPPGEFMAAKAVAGAIILAAVTVEPEKAGEKFQAFIQQGLEVVNRIKLWA